MNHFDAASRAGREIWIGHPQGRLFARVWEPSDEAQGNTERTPVVLFHDSLGCVDLWRDFPAQLCAATGRRIIAYDRLGFGRSDPRQARPALDFIADEAHTFFPAVREQLGIARFIALGHSVGGGMAIHCAARSPAECEAVITESAQAFLEDRTVEGIEIAKRQFGDAEQIARLEKYHGKKAAWVLDAWTETWLDPQFADWSLAAVLPHVSCPVLAIHGALDEYGSTRHPEMIGRLCGGPSRVEVIEDTHHVPHRERAELVIRLASGFLASLP